MANARGDEAKLFSRQQAAFGTAAAAGDGAFRLLPFYSYNVTPSEERNEDEAIRGDAFPGDSVLGLRTLSGQMVVPIGINSIGWHLRNILGDPVTSGSTDFEHVFTAAAVPGIPMVTNSITHSRIGQHFVQDSLTCTSFEIAARKEGQYSRATLNMLGRAEQGVGATVDATPVEYAPDPVPTGFQGKVLAQGAEAAEVTAFDMTLTSGVETDQESMNQSPNAAGFESPRWGLTGNISARFVDRTWYDYAANDTPVALALELAIAANKGLTILIPDVRFAMTGVPVEGRGPISASFSFQAMRPAAGQEFVTFTLANQTADYANPV